MNFLAIYCLFLACVVAFGCASNSRGSTPTCPRSWTGNPGTCEWIDCNSTRECERNGAKGTCCRTSCGGQGCYFESIRIERQASSEVDVCPLQSWMGQNNKKCKRHECARNEQCVRNSVRGLCCVTSCGGHNCYYPEKRCPASASWAGLDSASCAKNLCNVERDCKANGAQGFCCQTSCAGRNCFFLNATKPAAEVSHKTKRNGHSCPSKGQWIGVSAKKCSHMLCSADSQCGEMELCCSTKCGGKSCYMPRHL